MSSINIMPVEYKLDEKPYNIMTAQEDQLTEYKSDDAVIEDNSVVRIQVKDISTFTNLNRAYIELRWKLTKADNTAFTQGDKIGLAGEAMCLFSRCVLRIQNSIVETIDENHLTTIIKSLLHFSGDYAQSSASNQFYFKDTGTLLDSSAPALRPFNNGAIVDGQAVNLLNIVENPEYNKGHAIRITKTDAGKIASAFIPLRYIFGWATIDRVMTGNTISLEFTKSNSNEHLLKGLANGGGALADGKVRFEKMSLWCPRILPSPALELSLKSAMGGGVVSQYKYPVYNAYTSDVQAGGKTGSVVFRVLTTNEKIVNVFVYCRQPAEQLKSKTKTENCLTELELRLNGKSFPNRRYDNLAPVVNTPLTEGKTRAYADLLHYLNKDRDLSSGIQLSREEYEDRTIYHFDTTNVPENWAKSSSTLEVNANFRATTNNANPPVATDLPTQIVVVVVSERMATINYGGSQPTVSVN